MSLLNVVLLLIVIMGGKIKDEAAVKFLKTALAIGIVYWLAVVFLKLPLGPEILIKSFTAALIFRAYRRLTPADGRTWTLSMLVVAALDIILITVSYLMS